MMSIGMFCLVLSMLIHAYAINVLGFYIGGIMLGVGLSWTSTTIVGYVLNKWCTEKKGTVMGAILASQGLGSAIAVQIIVPLIYQGENAFGYRDAYKLIALILCVVCILVVLLFKENPGVQEKSYEETQKKIHVDKDGPV